jgi:hypothetical protein
VQARAEVTENRLRSAGADEWTPNGEVMVMAFMTWEEPGMSPDQTRALVRQIAEVLGSEWTVAEDRHRNAGRWELHASDGIELCVQVGPAQVAVRGIHGRVGANLPYVYGCKQPVIRFSVDKTPQRMAAEITRRLLPAVREDAATLAAERADRDARLAARLVTLERARDLLGGDLAWAEPDAAGQPAEYEHASSPYRPTDMPRVAIDLNDDKRHDHLDEVRVSNLDHQEVLVVVEAAARVIEAARTARQVRPITSTGSTPPGRRPAMNEATRCPQRGGTDDQGS